ncbi:MAG: hypothetical protein WKF79_15950 [Nocardioides sp.]
MIRTRTKYDALIAEALAQSPDLMTVHLRSRTDVETWRPASRAQPQAA